jgi:cyclopropane fatty-acyl-phospholipid synthase-like methyltransferase
VTDKFFDAFYSGGDGYYGGDTRPEYEAFLRGLPGPSPRLLDLACGQGRHAVPAARAGAKVHAVDYSRVAIDQLAALAAAEDLPIRAECADIRNFALPAGGYNAAVLVSTLSHFDETDLEPLVGMVFDALAPGGHIFVEGFTTADPAYSGAGDASETAGALKHFFAPGALAELFGRFAIAEYREFVEDDTAHGPVHQHGVALLIGRKA